MKLFGINLSLPNLKFMDPREARFVIIAGLVIAATMLAGIIPNTYQLIQVSSKMSQMKSKARTAQEKIKNLPHLRESRKNYIEKITTLENQFFDADQISEMIGIISELAKEAGITIKSSKQYEYKGKDDISKNPFYRPILFRLELEGGYHNFGKFANLLERHSKFIRISEMNAEQSEEKKGKLAMELSVLTFLKVGPGVSQ